MAIEEQKKAIAETGRVTLALISQEELLDRVHSLLDSLGSHLSRVLTQVDADPESPLAEIAAEISTIAIGEGIQRNNRRLEAANDKVRFLIDHLEI